MCGHSSSISVCAATQYDLDATLSADRSLRFEFTDTRTLKLSDPTKQLHMVMCPLWTRPLLALQVIRRNSQLIWDEHSEALKETL